jgi:protocatechuate 3,4-dioxygenase beta subunit
MTGRSAAATECAEEIMAPSRRVLAAVVSTLLFAGTPARALAAQACPPTEEDQLGPFYEPNAPVRSSVGKGHVLRGTVRSSVDCTPIAGARVELWLAGPSGYDDAHRATVVADAAGRYAFESEFPGPFERRPPHIHVRVAHPGYRTLVTQHYPTKGQPEATFDLVLRAGR